MSSFRCILTLDNQEFPVVHCSYQFSQAITERGRAGAKVRSGLLTLHLDVPDGDQLVGWANDPQKKHNGYLTFHETDLPVARERLDFEDGFCVSYDEVFSSGAEPEGAYRCILQISAAKLTLGTTEKDNTWEKTR
ncbi:type VI secretion system tube protein TssD [Hymenobacter terrenus]|uniref:type VI secretion system tube protein TssD n=1 Tax=Hymenobacter terrenus TaxID=1629124 RepID=UPI0006985D99|nr:type VI secretion system tube protein TssD [Hymenobacter terrenus]